MPKIYFPNERKFMTVSETEWKHLKAKFYPDRDISTAHFSNDKIENYAKGYMMMFVKPYDVNKELRK